MTHVTTADRRSSSDVEVVGAPEVLRRQEFHLHDAQQPPGAHRWSSPGRAGAWWRRVRVLDERQDWGYSMYTDTCTFIYIYIHIYIHTYIYIYVCVCISKHVYLHSSSCIHTYIYINAYTIYIYIYIYIYIPRVIRGCRPHLGFSYEGRCRDNSSNNMLT